MQGTDISTFHGSSAHAPTRPPVGLWVGRTMSGVVLVFLFGASLVPKFFLPELANASLRHLGWNTEYLLAIGLIEHACTVLYAIPRTALWGAVLLTGHLGGAIATHLRAEDPLFSHVLFPVYVGVLAWGGLVLRNPGLLAALSLNTTARRSAQS